MSTPSRNQYRYLVGKITILDGKTYVRKLHIDGVDHDLPPMKKGEKIMIDGIPVKFDGVNYIAYHKDLDVYC